MSRAEAHRRERRAPDGAARDAAPFPVDGLYSDYDTLVDAYRTITVAFTPGERRALFHDNAQRFYRL